MHAQAAERVTIRAYTQDQEPPGQVSRAHPAPRLTPLASAPRLTPAHRNSLLQLLPRGGPPREVAEQEPAKPLHPPLPPRHSLSCTVRTALLDNFSSTRRASGETLFQHERTQRAPLSTNRLTC